jgi:hypothetical protein
VTIRRHGRSGLFVRRPHEALWLPVSIGGLGMAGATLPAFEQAANRALCVLLALALLIWIVLRVRRAVRWRREDREDAAAGATWWAAQRELVSGDRR